MYGTPASQLHIRRSAHRRVLTLLQFSQTTTLAREPPKRTFTNGTRRLSSGISSYCCWAPVPDAADCEDGAKPSRAMGSNICLVGDDGADGAGDGSGDGIGDIPAFDGLFELLRFLPEVAGG